MKKAVYYSITWCFYFSINVIAIGGGDVGGNSNHGGGNSAHHVDCDGNGPVQGGYLLDYLEGEMNQDPHTPDLGSDTLSLEDKAMIAIERLAVFDPVRADRYKNHIHAFFANAEKVNKGPDLDFKKDAGAYDIPANCRLRQLVISRPFHPTIKQYIYDERLFLKMSPTHQAGTLLHEAIYSDTLALGQTNSETTRKFNALISSKDFKAFSQSEYDDLAKKIFEPQFGPEFKAGKMFTNVFAEKEFSIGLRSLLSNEGGGKLTWTFLNTLPAWLRFNPEEEKLSGTVPSMEPQSIDIQLVAFDGKKSALAILELRLKKKGP